MRPCGGRGKRATPPERKRAPFVLPVFLDYDQAALDAAY
jgi:hypothetical protein